LKKLENK